MDKKEEFSKALFIFLNSAELHLFLKTDKLTDNAQYHNICFMKVYYKENSKEPYQLLVPLKSWHDFLIELGRIFDNKINRKLTGRLISEIVCKLEEFPFTESNLKRCAEEIFTQLWKHYELIAEALVPLYNIEFLVDKEIQLANAALCPGTCDSIFSQKVNHPDFSLLEARSDDNCFLRIEVSGDDESRLSQVEAEVKNSLIVLRFVTMFRTNRENAKHFKYNPASVVAMRPRGELLILYHKPDEISERPGYFKSYPDRFYIDDNSVKIAYESYGLEDLNYHFGNSDNPVSRRIIRALELYDSGINTLGNWQSLYRYVVAINVVIPKSGSGGKEIVPKLTTLIQYRGQYIGSMKRGDSTSPEELSWEELVRNTTEPFKKFYTLRGKILHGNLPIEDVSEDDLEYARTLAHNAIRAMAFLARQFNWQDDKEVETWFKSPDYPPGLIEED